MVCHRLLKLALFLVCLFTPSWAFSDSWNPFNTTDAEIQYIIDTYAGKTLIDYAESVGVNITVTNSLQTSFRYAPFIELLYANGTKNSEGNFYDVWNSALVPNQLNTNQNEQLDYSSDVPGIFNLNKQLMFDMLMMALPSQNMIAPLPVYKYFPFTSNPSLNVTFQYFSSIREKVPEGESNSFNAKYSSSVYRQSTYLYYPNTRAYILLYQDPDTAEKQIFVMQAFSNQVNNQMTPDQLIVNPVASTATTNPLTPSIIPPENWTFAYIDLDRMLIVQAYGEARIISDNLTNAYMYINRDSTTEWLYAKYDYTSTIPVAPKPAPAPPIPASGAAAYGQICGVSAASAVIAFMFA